MNNKKYIAIGLVALGILVVTYLILIVRSQTQNPPPISPTTVPLPTNPGPTNNPSRPFTFPTSTVAPTIPLPTTVNKDLYSPVDQSLLDNMRKDEIYDRPDITVSNSLPYQNEFFLANSEFISTQPEHFKIIIYMKTENKTAVQQSVLEWFKSLYLPEESIQKLDIEYKPQIDPNYM